MDIIDVYNKVTDKNNLTRCCVTITSKTIDDHQTLLEEITQFKTEEGWLCYQSEVVRLSSGMLPDREDKVLSGELAKGNRSLHIRQRKAGWLISKIVSSHAGDTTADKDVCLAKKVSYLVDQNESAEYEVFLEKGRIGADNNNCLLGGYIPKSYRFLGFQSWKECSC